MNPIAIVYRHWKSLQSYDVDQIMAKKKEGKVFALTPQKKHSSDLKATRHL